jgi:hypothetical protein
MPPTTCEQAPIPPSPLGPGPLSPSGGSTGRSTLCRGKAGGVFLASVAVVLLVGGHLGNRGGAERTGRAVSTPSEAGDAPDAKISECRSSEQLHDHGSHETLRCAAYVADQVVFVCPEPNLGSGRRRGRYAGRTVCPHAMQAPVTPKDLVTCAEGKGSGHPSPLSTYSAPGGLRQDPGRAAESTAEAKTWGMGNAECGCCC